MNLYKFMAGEFVDPLVPESIVEFTYEIVDVDLPSAVDKFYTIFPGTVILKYSTQYA